MIGKFFNFMGWIMFWGFVFVCIFAIICSVVGGGIFAQNTAKMSPVTVNIEDIVINSRGTLTGIWYNNNGQMIILPPNNLTYSFVKFEYSTKYQQWFANQVEGNPTNEYTSPHIIFFKTEKDQSYMVLRAKTPEEIKNKIYNKDGRIARWVLEIHFKDFPKVNTATHGKFGEY